MLALIAGTGDLPGALVARLSERPLICALQGFEPAIPADVTFRLEHLGSFLVDLKARGISRICMAGAVRRPVIDPQAIDAATVPLIPKVQAAMAQGDDGALRVIIALLEDAGFAVVAAHEIAPDLLPPSGVLTKAAPMEDHKADAMAGQACVAAMGAADTGQACVIRAGQVVLHEDSAGTDAMLGRADAPGGILFKAPKPGQDRRADLPIIGPGTIAGVIAADLSGVVIAGGGVMVLDMPAVLARMDEAGLFLWVRP